MVNAMDAEAHADDWKNEDLEAKGEVETTIKGVNMHAADWVEQAAAKTHAAEGDDYVKLDRGVLTVNQLNWFLNSMPMELTYADANNQFLYYNHQMDGDKMLASRTPAQAGNPLADCHPKRAVPGVKRAVHMLRTGETDLFKLPVPGIPNKYVMHYYQALHDDKGEYKGINEFVLDLLPIVKYYLKQTGQMLAPDPDAKTDAVSGASSKAKETKPDAAPAVDDVSGASADTEAAPEAAPEAPTKPEAPDVDSVSGASAK